MDRPLNLYEKLHALAYDVAQNLSGETVSTVIDPDMVEAYHTMIKMRWALITCRDQFAYYRGIDENHLSDTMTLVEAKALKERLQRHEQLVLMIDELVRPTPKVVDWMDISTAPQTGKPIRLLGKRDDGSTYIETGAWANILWSVEQLRGHRKPTHWRHLEGLPEGYS